MDILLNWMGWLIVGGIVMVAELIVPGGVVFFLGLACLLVAAGIFLGLITSWVSALTFFFISSLLLVISLRFLVSRFAQGDASVSNTDELMDEVDEIVEVIEPIGPAQKTGLVKFRGTHWQALSDGSLLAEGSQARIVSRDNITLIVTPYKTNASQDYTHS